MTKIAIVAFDDCMTSALTGLVDAFGLASFASSQLRPGSPTHFETTVVSVDAKPVKGSGGFVIQAGGDLRAAHGCDVVAVPPIMGDVSRVLTREQELLGWLSKAHDKTNIICSVCTGAFLLAQAGLLNDRRATTNPQFGDALQRAFPRVKVVASERIVDERSVICAGSRSAFIDLAIYLVDRFAGHDIAVWTAKALSRDKNFESQQPYFLFVAPRDHGDDVVLKLQDWMQQHYAESISTEDLARRGALSLRSLSRRFDDATGLSPMEYLRRLRIEAAKRLLESSHDKVDRIADDVGYSDARSFVRSFKLLVGTAPSAYRRRFRFRNP
jgi:transcriptional regulator GlxA family with amidase domain